MTIQIPDDIARGLEGMAYAQSKSAEQVAVEGLRLLVNRTGSPQALLELLRSLPRPDAAIVDEMNAAIAAARMPVRDEGPFDGRSTG
jgi:hypothetical protein